MRYFYEKLPFTQIWHTPSSSASVTSPRTSGRIEKSVRGHRPDFTGKRVINMKTDRLLGIIMLLLQRDKITAPELAERFEVSRRTIHRDIEALCMAGIPLVTTQGGGGGIAIADGYKIDKAFLTSEEWQAVLAALKGLDSVSKTPRLAALSDKLGSKGRHITADDTILIDLASHYQAPLVQKIDAIQHAIRERRLFTFCYESKNGPEHRTIEPHRLVFQWGAWYVLGYCKTRKAFRLFKLNRLSDECAAEVCFAPRAIPAEALDFSGYLERKNHHLKALFAGSERYRLIDEYGTGCYAQDASGALLFERDFASYENLREWVWSFGDRVHILEPQALAEERRRQAQNILNMGAP